MFRHQITRLKHYINWLECSTTRFWMYDKKTIAQMMSVYFSHNVKNLLFQSLSRILSGSIFTSPTKLPWLTIFSLGWNGWISDSSTLYNLDINAASCDIVDLMSAKCWYLGMMMALSVELTMLIDNSGWTGRWHGRSPWDWRRGRGEKEMCLTFLNFCGSL